MVLYLTKIVIHKLTVIGTMENVLPNGDFKSVNVSVETKE